MGIDEQQGIPVIHNLNNGAANRRLQLGHIAVDIEAVGFRTCADQFRCELTVDTMLA